MVTQVTLADGARGILEQDGAFGETGKAVIRLETGQEVVVPADALIQEPGGYRLPFTTQELAAGGAAGADAAKAGGGGNIVVPLLAETLRVTKEQVVTGGVRLTKRVTEREETVDEPLLRENVQVERLAINQMVAEAPEARQEGDTLVVPILEEVLVVEKRLLLKEEVRITRTRTEVHQPQAVTLRAEEAVIEEIAPR